jgi:glucosamine--fructose-6-phosphate aminotransferase (isomerizing)
MCGIVGFIGSKNCSDILLDGLTKLEYRGYDSAGIALLNNSEINRYRANGKLNNLKKLVYSSDILDGSIGIGHTRWATHGIPSEKNAHPHNSKNFVIVHNGIIENYRELRSFMLENGTIISSETDSEMIVHLIEFYYASGLDFEKSVLETIKKLEGAFAVLVMSRIEEKVIAFKKDSPMIIGVSNEGTYMASDVPAILSYTNQFIYLEDEEIVVMTKTDINVFDFNFSPKEYEIKTLNISPLMAEKGDYKHFMLKEINEQSRSVADTFRGRVLKGGDDLDLDLNSLDDFIKNDLRRVVIIACGTSWHSGLIAKYMIESISRIPVEVDYASEYRYRNPILDKNTLIIPISQSGETADTLAAVKMAKKDGCKILSVCNVFNSSIPRESDDVLYTYAGPEIGVASTKAFTTQISVLLLLAIYLKKIRMNVLESEILKESLLLPEKINKILKNSDSIFKLSQKYNKYSDFLYLGRGVNFPIALEGALKLKEISYVHAEAYPAGEMKHGPIALIDENMPTFIIATSGNHYEKVLSNLQEIKARKGQIITIATEGNTEIKDFCEDVIYVPKSLSILEPFLSVIPMQLFAYYVADIKGTDVDQPRNLAKSVTVE